MLVKDLTAKLPDQYYAQISAQLPNYEANVTPKMRRFTSLPQPNTNNTFA
jgi:hypothetical protein